MARPNPLDNKLFAGVVERVIFREELTRQQMCDILGVKDRDTITRWRRDPRFNNGKIDPRVVASIERSKARNAARRVDPKARAAVLARDRAYYEAKSVDMRNRSYMSKMRKHHPNFVEDVDRLALYQRDEGICGICREPVREDDFHVDHIVPTSKGGAHSYGNTHIAHPGCNSRKSARLVL